MKYSVTEKEVLEFAKRLYAEGFGGFMDLCDSSCEKMVQEFLEGKKIESPTQLNLPVPNVSITSGLFGNPQQGQIQLLGSEIFTIGDGMLPDYRSPNDQQERR